MNLELNFRLLSRCSQCRTSSSKRSRLCCFSTLLGPRKIEVLHHWKTLAEDWATVALTLVASL